MKAATQKITLWDSVVKHVERPVQTNQTKDHRDVHVLDFAQVDAVWEAEGGVCIRTNKLHATRGGDLFYPEPFAALIREAVGGEILAAAPQRVK